MRKNLAAILTLVFLFTFVNPILGAPDKDIVDVKIHTLTEENEVELEAQSAVLVDLKTGDILYSKDKDKRLYPASTTKILIGLLALENGDLNDIITIGNEANLCTYDSSIAGLDIGEEISLENLLYGLMLPSGNDAAYAIAVYIGRKLEDDPELSIADALKSFTNLMNRRAHELGAVSSHFVTPDGYHDDEHYTTTLDMALIAMEAMKHDIFREIVSTEMFTIPDWSSLHDPDVEESDKETRYWWNSNLLIQPKNKFYYPGVTGVKTGYTSKAMHCLVTSASRDDMDVLAVVFASSKTGKWVDTTALLDYGFDNFEVYEPFGANKQVSLLKVTNNPQFNWVRVMAEESPVHLVPKKHLDNITHEIQWSPEIDINNVNGVEQASIPAPVEQFQKVGTLTIKLNGDPIDKVDLITPKAVKAIPLEEPNLPSKLKNKTSTLYLEFWNNRPLWQKLSFGGASLALFILPVWLGAVKRKRRRYAFRRRY